MTGAVEADASLVVLLDRARVVHGLQRERLRWG